MSKLKMIGTRVEENWIEQIRALANVAGQKESEIVRSAIAQYLNQHDPIAVKGAIATSNSNTCLYFHQSVALIPRPTDYKSILASPID